MLEHLPIEILHQIGWQFVTVTDAKNFLDMHPRMLRILNTPYFWKNVHLKTVNFNVTLDDLEYQWPHVLAHLEYENRLKFFRLAAENGHLHGLKWLHRIYGLGPKDARARDNYALRYAAANGHLEVMQWLHTTYGLGPKDARACDNWALGWVAAKGHLHVLQWLYTTYRLGPEDARACDNWALRMAAYYGHTKVVKWLKTTFSM